MCKVRHGWNTTRFLCTPLLAGRLPAQVLTVPISALEETEEEEPEQGQGPGRSPSPKDSPALSPSRVLGRASSGLIMGRAAGWTSRGRCRGQVPAPAGCLQGICAGPGAQTVAELAEAPRGPGLSVEDPHTVGTQSLFMETWRLGLEGSRLLSCG